LEKAQRPNEMWQPMRRCQMVLDHISEDSFAEIFLEPVSLEDFPDYNEFIDTPMDLGTVREKLKIKDWSKKYQSPEQFARDVRKVWNNCKIYNRHGSAIWHVADYMSKQFERLYHAWVLEFRERYLRWAHPLARPWEHSCRQCDGKCKTPEKEMVVCDHCDASYGFKCLKPPLKKLPKGVWHCPECKPKLKGAKGARMMSAVAEQAARKRAELGDIPKRKTKQVMYLVKWAGLGYEFCTWETKQDIGNNALIAEFHKLNNSFPDEPDMPHEVVNQVLNTTTHLESDNAGGQNGIPSLRAQLYAQTRAFQFQKFGQDLPEKVCNECGPITKAATLAPLDAEKSDSDLSRNVLEAVTEMTYRVSWKESVQLMKVNSQLPPLLSGEYDAAIPVTAKGLMMNVGELNGHVAFLGYRQFPDGSRGPAEINRLVRSKGDQIIAVNGVSTIKKTFQEVIALLREAGKAKFAFMRFLDTQLAGGDGELSSVGAKGQYAFEELKKKFSADRKGLIVQRSLRGEEDVEIEEDSKEDDESDGSAGPHDSDDDSSEGEFRPDSDAEDEENPDSPAKETKKEDEEVRKNDSEELSDSASKPTAESNSEKTELKAEDTLVLRPETTRSLAMRLLSVDIDYSSDEGGDADGAFYVDGVDDTFTSMADIPKEIVEASEAAKKKKDIEKKKKDDEEEEEVEEDTLPVRRNDFSTLGDRAKLAASVALTNQPPDVDDFDNFPMPSTKALEAQKKKEEEQAAQALLLKNDDPDSPQKPTKLSTVKIEQISIQTNEPIHVWPNVETASATLQISLAELRRVLKGDYDEDLGDEVGGFRWRYAAAGAEVTAPGAKDDDKTKKGSKKGREAWLEFRDKLYDPSEPHVYKNGNRLRDYQVEGVNWLASTYYRKHGCILADGKSEFCALQ
jgi:hypothetical protein